MKIKPKRQPLGIRRPHRHMLVTDRRISDDEIRDRIRIEARHAVARVWRRHKKR